MTYQRDPNDPVTERRAAVREEGSWGVFPAVLGVIFLLLVGLIAYNMYTADTGPNVANPSASNTTRTAPSTLPPQSTPDTAAPPVTTPPATTSPPPANQ